MKIANPIFLLSMLLFLVQGINYASAAVVVEIARDFNLHISEAGLFVTAYLLPYGAFTLLYGPLADKYGKERVLGLGAFATAVSCALGGFAVNFTSLSLMRALNGIVAPSIIPVVLSFIGEKYSYDIKARQNALGKAFGMMFLGAALAPFTAGVLAYLVSWRMVYFTYGAAVLFVAVFIYIGLEKLSGVEKNLTFKAYKEALVNKKLVKLSIVEFFLGFSVFGSFMYSGDFVQQVTGYNIFWVGASLTFFGLATVIGGRYTTQAREVAGNHLFLYAGFLGLISWGIMGFLDVYYFMILSFLGFGFSFIFLHTPVIAKAQEMLSGKKGLVMSFTSFFLFAGGGIGTLINSYILRVQGFRLLFLVAGMFIFVAGVLAKRFLSEEGEF